VNSMQAPGNRKKKLFVPTVVGIVGLFCSFLHYTWPQLNISLPASFQYLITNTLAGCCSMLFIVVDAIVGFSTNFKSLIGSSWTCYISDSIDEYYATSALAQSSVQLICWFRQKLDEVVPFVTMLSGWLSKQSSSMFNDVIDTTAIHYSDLMSQVEKLQTSYNSDGFINYLKKMNPVFHCIIMLPCWICVLLGIFIIGGLTYHIYLRQPRGSLTVRQRGKSAPIPSTALSSCLKVRHLVNPGFSKEVWAWMVKDEILQRCFTSNKAQIVHIAVNIESPQGCVYIMAKDMEEAAKVFEILHNKWYFGNLVTVKYMRESRYHDRFPDSRYKKEVLKSLIE